MLLILIKNQTNTQECVVFNNDCVRKLAHDLKLLGQAAIQIVYSKDGSQVVKAEHFPVETLRAEKADENGEIAVYYYCPDWTKANQTRNTNVFHLLV